MLSKQEFSIEIPGFFIFLIMQYQWTDYRHTILLRLME